MKTMISDELVDLIAKVGREHYATSYWNLWKKIKTRIVLRYLQSLARSQYDNFNKNQ